VIWLRPGLDLEDLLNRLDKIAVACWASAAVAEADRPRRTPHVRERPVAVQRADRPCPRSWRCEIPALGTLVAALK
jgi:hypothetical protein